MSVPSIVFVVYFGIVFLIGWLSLSRTRDEKDYWIAGGDLGWLVGGATLSATHASAGTFVGTIGVIYTVGWSFAWIVLSIPLAYWFTAAVLAPRFVRTRELTLPAFLERRYASKSVRAVAALVILVATCVYVQAQIVAGGLIANVVFGISRESGMVIFTAILLLYTAVGGMLAVVYTDFVQLVVMVMGVACALPLAVREVGGWARMFELVEAVKPETFRWETLPPALIFTMGIAFTLGSVATPEKLVRLYAMRDMKAIRRGLLMAIVVATGLNLMIFVIALTAIVLFPVLPTGDLAMPMIARAVLPPFLGAILLAAIGSAIMSTVDSLMLVAGSALSHDIYTNVWNRDASPSRRLWMARGGILLVGVVPLALILSGVGQGELVQFIVLLFTALMAASFFVPVLVGVYWRRATKQGALASMIGGSAATMAWKLYGSPGLDPVLAGLLSAFTLMVVVSLLTPPSPHSALAPYFESGD